ncbi:MAG TPA: S8 family serine peptidase, partial [Vicinamibacteria bacterium]|nr:S8 family serine peptidase [Vicinamibacteria bacterium]
SGSFGWVISGILYAATPLAQGGAGADIINMSLGALFPRGGGHTGAGLLVAALNKAVNYAGRNGVLVVSAAGNDETDLDHSGSYIAVPAQSGSGIAVSATGPLAFAYGATNFRRIASYTNYGNSVVNVAAPGGDFMYPGNELCTLPRSVSGTVTAPCWVFDMVMSTSRGSGSSTTSYSWAAGTSMAAPAASAVAALIKQRNPGISLGALKTRLEQTADDEGKQGNDPFYGKGFVNADRACTAQ